ncbi:hypothetical protein [Sulfitobacter sp. MF3-043]|uniref:hypothetical protein n=1 Tax=Sulfitobacter sediminivivens TaxID=3252902 RepID=UPI0036DB96E5
MTKTLTAADDRQAPDVLSFSAQPEILLSERLEREHSFLTAVFVIAWVVLITLPFVG